MNMTEMGLFTGTSKPVNGVGTFAPNGTMTRAQFIVVITRVLFGDEIGSAEDSSAWFEPNWKIAVEKDILLKDDFGGLAGLNQPITREEMSYIMLSALFYKGENPKFLVDSSAIADYDTVDDRYAFSVLSCYSAGIIAGVDSKGTFAPKETVTRAQGATLLYRLINPEVRVPVDFGFPEPIIDVKDNLDIIKQTFYEDYNDKVVTGNMVRAAIQNFEGKAVAILINTVAMTNGDVTHKNHPSIQYLYASDMNSNINIGAKIVKTTGNKPLNTNSKYGNFYINYNMLLELDNSATVISFKDGVYDAKSVFPAVDNNGRVTFDNFTDGILTEGNSEYVNTTAKFSANLMKDAVGSVIGIIFTEISR